MLFRDESVRDHFHKSNSTLQVLCGVAEATLNAHGAQLEVMGVDCMGGEWQAFLEIHNASWDQMVDLCESMQRIFVRGDKRPIIRILDKELGWIVIMVADGAGCLD